MTTARERVRAELSQEILDAAKSELAESGAAGLSLRAVARRMEMVPSALYRYYASRDHLLTALIVDAYTALAATEAHADRRAGPDPWKRWVAIGRSVRRWAAEHPHEWALIFGSPVPGYRGDDATTAAATGVHAVPLGVLGDAHRMGRLADAGSIELPAAAARAHRPITALVGDVPLPLVAAGTAAWTQVLGHVSLERFGHFTGAVSDLDAQFNGTLALAASLMGLRAADPRR